MAGREKRRRRAADGESAWAAAFSSSSSWSDEQQQQAMLLLHNIKGLVRWVVAEVSRGRSPSLALHRYQTCCTCNAPSSCVCSSDYPVGKDIISLLHKDSHASRLKQAVVDRAINDICILLKCSRHNLNVVPVGKGLVMGWIIFMEGGKKFCCIRNLNTAFSIPVCVEAVKDVVSVAHYILVVEKETVFQRLANDKFCERNRCIVITGRGYPDIPTRRFLRYLVEQLHLPVYGLVDSDPYGFDILTTYRFGSMQLAYDAKLLRVPEIRWLGIVTSDFEEFCLPDCCLLNLTPEDRRKVEAMLTRCYLHREAPQWRSELEAMLQKGVKFEIEALAASSISFLSEEYIPLKIQQGRHL